MKIMHSFFSAATILAFALSAQAAHKKAPAAPAPLTDAQVLGLIATANNAEINAGQVAATKGQKPEVKAFGAKMVTDHTANNMKLAAVEASTKITRADSDASTQLKKDTDQMVDNLKSAKDADFDKSYIDGQVTMHQSLLNDLDNTLIPGAQNADIKAYLTDTRAVVESHLNEAKQIQTSLNTP